MRGSHSGRKTWGYIFLPQYSYNSVQKLCGDFNSGRGEICHCGYKMGRKLSNNKYRGNRLLLVGDPTQISHSLVGDL